MSQAEQADIWRCHTKHFVPSILDYLCDDVIRIELVPRVSSVYLTNEGDVKIVLSLLACIARVVFSYSVRTQLLF